MDRTADINKLQGEDQCLLLPHSQHSLNAHNVPMIMTLPQDEKDRRNKYCVIYCHYPKWGRGWWQEIHL